MKLFRLATNLVFAATLFCGCDRPRGGNVVVEDRSHASSSSSALPATRTRQAPKVLRFSPRPNRASEIHWRAWGADVFEDALREKKPVMLSISAVWCHWCHVLDETTLSDPRVSERINRETIAVRVDADVHPEIERRYLLGGWPTLALLDAQGRILDGGSYMETEQLMVKFDRVVPVVQADPEHAVERLGAMRLSRDIVSPGATLQVEDAAALRDALMRRLDWQAGGLNAQQKFPLGEMLLWLIDQVPSNEDAFSSARLWLDSMKTYLYDAAEGGFFRYGTQRNWSEPHYEKMLRTNAILIEAYARASIAYKDEVFAQMARKTWSWCVSLRTDGLAASSMDADENYYHGGRERGQSKPFVDLNVIAGTNAELALAGLRAGAVLHDEALQRQAETMGALVLSTLTRDDGTVLHARVGEELEGRDDLSDVAPMLELAAELGRTSTTHRARARAIFDRAEATLRDASSGAMFDRPEDKSALGLVSQRIRDPELNARYVLALSTLAQAQPADDVLQAGLRVMRAYGGGARSADVASVVMMRARERVGSAWFSAGATTK